MLDCCNLLLDRLDEHDKASVHSHARCEVRKLPLCYAPPWCFNYLTLEKSRLAFSKKLKWLLRGQNIRGLAQTQRLINCKARSRKAFQNFYSQINITLKPTSIHHHAIRQVVNEILDRFNFNLKLNRGLLMFECFLQTGIKEMKWTKFY